MSVMKRLRAVIYARVSGGKQKKDGTISGQLDHLPGWIASQGWDLVGCYTDDGKSASKNIERRGGLRDLRADASKDVYDVVVVAHMDRMSRTVDWGEFGGIIGDLQRNKKLLAAPNLPKPLEMGDGSSDMQLFFQWQVAAQENKTRMEKLLRGKSDAAKRGCLPQGRVPYGLAWRLGARTADGWSFHAEHAVYVREAFRRVVAGESAFAVAKDMERQGVKPPNGGRWLLGIIRILRGTYTRGEWMSLGVPIKVPALVDDVTWYAAQAALGPSKRRGLRQTKRVYLCEGLGACVCGGTAQIIGNQSSKPGRPTYRYYTCSRHTARRPHGVARCLETPMPVAKVDAIVWGEVLKFFDKPTKEILACLQAHQDEASAEEASWASDVTKLTTQLAVVEAIEVGLLDLVGVAGEKNVREKVTANASKRARLQEQLKVAQAAIGQAASSRSASTSLAALVDVLRARTPEASPAEQRELVTLLVEKGGIVMHRDGTVEVRLVFAKGETIERAVTLRAVA